MTVARESRDLDERLVDLLYPDELSPEEAAALRREVEAHPVYAERLRQLQRLQRAVRELPPVEPDPQIRYDLLREARAAVGDGKKKGGLLGLLESLALSPILAGAAVVAVVGGGMFLLQREMSDEAPATAARIPGEPPAAAVAAPERPAATPAYEAAPGAAAPASAPTFAAKGEDQQDEPSPVWDAKESVADKGGATRLEEAKPFPGRDAARGTLNDAPAPVPSAREDDLSLAREKKKQAFADEGLMPKAEPVQRPEDTFAEPSARRAEGGEGRGAVQASAARNAAPREESAGAERALGAKSDRDLASEDDGNIAGAPQAQAAGDADDEAPLRESAKARPAAPPPPRPAPPPARAETEAVAQQPAPETRSGGAGYDALGAGAAAPAGAAVAADAPPPALDRARQARAGRDFSRAAKLYEQAIRESRGADQAAALFEAAETYERLGDTSRALALYERAVRAGGAYGDRAREAAGRLRSLEAAPKKAPARKAAEPSMDFDAEQAAPTGGDPPPPEAPATEKR